MAYVALYRKWRPQDFNNLIGQEHIRKTLANAIEQGKVAHAYLFSGSRGTGKTSTAKILAKALNCEHGPTATPCNHCSCCEKINNGSFIDVFEIDAASNRGIDEIRELRETVKFAPVDGKYKVYIIDEVHMLTTEAFNALLKTLEEPPSHVVFILATTEVHKVPITIQSRCQRYDFKRITKEDILARLKEVMASTDITADEAALELIAIQSDGGMRDALSLLDQCLAFANGALTVKEVYKVLGLVGNNWIWQLTDQIINKEEYKILEILNNLIAEGKDLKQILSEFILHLRSLMIYKATNRMIDMEVYLEDETVLKRQSQALSHNTIVKLIQQANDTLNALKWAPHGRIALETMFLKMCWQEELNNDNLGMEKALPAVKPGIKQDETAQLLSKIQSMEQIIYNLSQQVKDLAINNQQITTTLPPSPPQQENNTTEVKAPPLASDTKQTLESLNKITAEPLVLPNTPNLSPDILNFDTPQVNQEMISEKQGLTISVPANLQMEYTGNIHQLWGRVKQVIRRTKGLIGLSRIIDSDVVPYQIVNNQLFINTMKSFVYHRFVQDIKQIEEAIAQIANLDIKIIPMLNGKPMSKLGVLPQDIQNLPGDNPPPSPIPEVNYPPMAPDIYEEEINYPLDDIPFPTDDDYEQAMAEPLNVAPPSTPQTAPPLKQDGDALAKAKDFFCTDDFEEIT